MKKSNTILLHLTDLHFGDNLSESLSVSDFTYNDIAKLIADTIKSNYKSKKLIIAFGGDITNKGQSKKYQYASNFIRTIKKELSDYNIDIILCPGNHDIEIGNDNWFGNFNIFSGEITEKQNFIYTKKRTCVLYETPDVSFVVINSIYHGDHTFGLIDTNQLEEKLKLAQHKIIVLLHHHLIPVLKDDTSTTRNSYDMIRLCLKYGVELIIHGHIHSTFKLSFGDSIKKVDIVGCGATLPIVNSNYNNQFNISEISKSKIKSITSYKITFDSIDSHKPQTIKIAL